MNEFLLPTDTIYLRVSRHCVWPHPPLSLLLFPNPNFHPKNKKNTKNNNKLWKEQQFLLSYAGWMAALCTSLYNNWNVVWRRVGGNEQMRWELTVEVKMVD